MVKIPMNLPAGPGQEAFLEHFNVQVSERMVNSRGQAGRRPDGVFESATTGPVAFNEGTIELSLRYEKSVDGQLLYIEADRVGNESTVLDWELLVRHLVHESSMAALAAKMQTFFRRTYRYYIGPQLDGEYWFGKLRFAPAWSEDDHVKPLAKWQRRGRKSASRPRRRSPSSVLAHRKPQRCGKVV